MVKRTDGKRGAVKTTVVFTTMTTAQINAKMRIVPLPGLVSVQRN